MTHIAHAVHADTAAWVDIEHCDGGVVHCQAQPSLRWQLQRSHDEVADYIACGNNNEPNVNTSVSCET